MDEVSLMRSKVDPEIIQKMQLGNDYEMIKVIIQTEDGLTDVDTRLVTSLGGKIKDNLYVINAYSADVTPKVIRNLVLSPRVLKIFNDNPVFAL